MAKPTKLNMAIVATDGSGKIHKFRSLKHASEKTGIAESTIKNKCNLADSSAIDNWKFSWESETTKKHFTAKRSKRKGSAFEREICAKLREIGYSGCVTARSESKRTDDNKIDIVDTNGELPVNIQAKYTQTLPNYFGIRDMCSDKSKPYVVLWKKASTDGSHSPGTVAVVPADYFYYLLKLHKQTNGENKRKET